MDSNYEQIVKAFKSHFQKTSSGGIHFNPDNHDQINMAISVVQIESNEKLSKSNENHARSMNWLTGGLLFVGVVQIIVGISK